MRKGIIQFALILSAACGAALAPLSAWAQHPIEVERQAANGEYLKALVAFDQLPARRATSGAIIAAARSAWALGLVDRAIKEFDRALRDPKLGELQRGKALVSRGIIEYQEERYQVALLYAERAINELKEESPLRAQAWGLWGESLAKIGSFGSAQEKLQKAIAEAPEDAGIEFYYRLGECQEHLGKFEDARKSFESVPLEHELAPAAIRHLGNLALEQQHYKKAAFWLNYGRQNFPDSFLDSWVDYALLVAATHEHDRARVVEIRKAASARYAPSDYWLTLLNSAAETFLWNESRPSQVARQTAEDLKNG